MRNDLSVLDYGWLCKCLFRASTQEIHSLRGEPGRGIQSQVQGVHEILCFFRKFQNIFRTLASLGFSSVVTPHQRCSRTDRKKEKNIFNEHPVVKTGQPSRVCQFVCLNVSMYTTCTLYKNMKNMYMYNVYVLCTSIEAKR